MNRNQLIEDKNYIIDSKYDYLLKGMPHYKRITVVDKQPCTTHIGGKKIMLS